VLGVEIERQLHSLAAAAAAAVAVVAVVAERRG